ncbi:MAG: nickel pincer cofactor biosynthesis protein LarC [Desulfobulbaceae bacterium]|nr:nickel pincer cofactor biosynthesis protein LarC [Desulfobulbaceae bacterium]
MRIAYLDCFSGISGDMLLGAFIDAGAPEKNIHAALDRLDLSGFRLDVSRTNESGLQAARVQVRLQHQEQHRHFPDLEKMILAGSLPERVRNTSINIFRRLAEAEAAVHGCKVEEVHFHEVGAVDAVVDIVGSVSCFYELGIKKLFCSPLPVSRGWVHCDHGDLPLPAPAVCHLLQGVPVYGENIDQELVTPTGAAIVRELADHFGPLPAMRLLQSGYGAGSMKRRDNRPNLLRLLIGDELTPEEAQRITVIETSLDDWSPEAWPHVLEKLLAGGALDVILTPVHMKKGRPGFTLKVICDPAHVSLLRKVIFSETSAIGLRYHSEERMTLPREIVTVATPWGPVKAKKIETDSGYVVTPEYEECRRLAKENNIPLRSVYQAVNSRGKA